MMSPTFLPAIPRAITVAQQGGLQLTTLSYLGSLFTTVTPQSLDETLDFLQESAAKHGTNFSIHLDVTDLRTTHDIVALLDAGAGKVFVSFQQLKELDSVKNIDPERLALRITEDRSETKEAIVEAIGDTAVDLYFHSIKDVPLIQEFLRLYGENRPAVYVSLATDAATSAAKATYLSLIQSSAIPIIPAAILSVEKELAPDSIPVASLLCVETDRPDGLIPTIVTNEGGIALGLVYSSSESLQESLRTGRGVYQSRKRGLWYKGESSGDIQQLVSISLDCDSDCLAFIVRQQGRGRAHAVNLMQALADHFQDSATWCKQPASASTRVLRSYKRHCKLEKFLRLKVLILLDCLRPRIFCEPRSWRRLRNCARPKQKRKWHLRQLI